MTEHGFDFADMDPDVKRFTDATQLPPVGEGGSNAGAAGGDDSGEIDLLMDEVSNLVPTYTLTAA